MRAGLTAAVVLLAGVAALAGTATSTRSGDAMLNEYFRIETAAVAKRCLADIKTLNDWKAKREEYRRELAEMLGLWPMPQRTDLKATITGKIDQPDFTVENLYFQSRPGLYVTGNLYLPKPTTRPAPAILYVCGHSPNKKNGISYGAKVGYQHHGAWFARNGYVCLVIDTLQLGEIEGIHHGTYREKMWWWHSRGYTPAGVEAWNSIRAIDYLQSRPEVDPNRIGITGRSGGGAYSWWTAALDERVKVAVPVAGITDMQNQVVDGCVEGHCDCMFMVNTYRWDFAQVAALIAPRPLLISNSDKDTIFPLDGVERLHWQVRRIYELYKAEDKLGLLITEGPHKDTQDLQVPAMRWFNRFLKNDTSPVENVAKDFFTPEQLKVFKELPTDQINTRVQEVFVPAAGVPRVPESAAEWRSQQEEWMGALKAKTFGGWPTTAPALDIKQAAPMREAIFNLRSFDFTSQDGIRLRMYILFLSNVSRGPERVVLHVLDDEAWLRWSVAMREAFKERFADEPGVKPDADGLIRLLDNWDGISVLAFVAPRGIGPTAWDSSERKQTQIRRRFALLGQTLEGMQAWDICRAVAALRELDRTRGLPVEVRAEGQMAALAAYASIFAPVAKLELTDPPLSHRDGPQLLNVLKTLDVPAAVAMVAERSQVVIRSKSPAGWEYPVNVGRKLGWPDGRVKVMRK